MDKTQRLSEALTWDEIANLYDQRTGGTARIRPIDKIFDWAESQQDIVLDEEEGTLHKVIEENS